MTGRSHCGKQVTVLAPELLSEAAARLLIPLVERRINRAALRGRRLQDALCHIGDRGFDLSALPSFQ